MAPAWAKAHLTGALWLPLLWLLLSQVSCSHALPGWRFTSSEIVIPRKVSHRLGGAGVRGQLSYRIHFSGRRHVVHMKVKKNLLPRHFPVITDNDQGAMQEDYPFIPRDCYYFSYLEGVPGSMGTLDTCYGGLRGMLQMDDSTYEIKPMEASSKFEHVVSLLVKEQPREDESCTIEKEDADPAYEEAKFAETPRAAPVYLWWPHRRDLKLHYTVSNSLFRSSPNKTDLIERVVMINSILHSIFHQHLLVVNLLILCIWDDTDHTDVTAFNNAPKAMERFGLWKYYNMFGALPHDTTILLTGHKIAGANHFGFQHGLCNPNWGAMFVYVANVHLFLGAGIAAHTLGHIFGMEHDGAGCKCFRRTFCVMAPTPGLNDMFSNCSYTSIHFRLQGYDECLAYTQGPYNNFPYVAPRCGDKIINQREECDCGSLKDCAENKCCETNCALSLGSDCSAGECCVNCKYANPGWICREKGGICDLSEYCDGKTNTCPNDFYIQDGTPCSPLAVCVRGNCSDRDMQCQALFGYKVSDAPQVCYDTLNVRGDRFGSCGQSFFKGGERHKPCEQDDVLCGTLHCRDIQQVPGGGEHTTFHQLLAKQEMCFGYDTHFGIDLPPLALVIDGATCGPGSYCYNMNCTFHQDMAFDCDVKKCNYRGVCNNNKNCHCQKGWRPPQCENSGPGGSIDSGPPPDIEPSARGRISMNVNQGLVVLMIRSALLLCAFIIGCISYLSTDEDEED
ncbi:disintegrin and metalloproteinase domain-containing protein 20-like [Myotis myotis]|uniref:disintegrin and metalloproteinase domain-containing protein 20-like n=1 Tax=Myotis myotis TaxID=51298 RepID=UPI001748E092|nr:disintegrin and metalloproteinase domain-containing protein 20-like [Myotis myotis]